MDQTARRQDAQRRADRIRAFRAELAQLQTEGALELTAEQRARLDQHLDQTIAGLAAQFDIDTSEGEKRASWGMRIASTLGALALATALVLFLYRFWALIPVPAQVTILVAVPLALLAATAYAARHETGLYFTGLLAVVALAAFVADLSMLGATFNLFPTPNALAAWAAFAILVAYRYGLRLLLAAGLVSGGAWLAAMLVSLTGAWWENFMNRPETVIVAGFAVAAAPRARGFAGTHRLTGLLAVFLAALVLSVSGRSSYLTFGSRDIERLYQFAGLVGGAGAIWIGVRCQWNETVNLAATFFVIFLYIRLAEWWWEWMPKYLFFFLAGLVAIGLLLAFRRLRAGLREVRP